MKEYFIMTSEQKKVLDDICKALDIPFESFLEIANIKDLKAENEQLKERVLTCEKKMLEVIRAFNELSSIVSAMKVKLDTMDGGDIDSLFANIPTMQNEEKE